MLNYLNKIHLFKDSEVSKIATENQIRNTTIIQIQIILRVTIKKAVIT